ncbi:MAG: hypothetical protein K0A94_06290, partial [Desulfuromonadales bacterium]|nr:hypothetical protein [Desulfuromonadales bacterium]
FWSQSFFSHQGSKNTKRNKIKLLITNPNFLLFLVTLVSWWLFSGHNLFLATKAPRTPRETR